MRDRSTFLGPQAHMAAPQPSAAPNRKLMPVLPPPTGRVQTVQWVRQGMCVPNSQGHQEGSSQGGHGPKKGTQVCHVLGEWASEVTTPPPAKGRGQTTSWSPPSPPTSSPLLSLPLSSPPSRAGPWGCWRVGGAEAGASRGPAGALSLDPPSGCPGSRPRRRTTGRKRSEPQGSCSVP